MLKEAEVGPSFAVKGTDREVLQGIYNVLVKGEKPIERFPAGTEISVVFFAHPAHPNIKLDRVVRKGNTVEIRYMLSSDVVQTLVVNPYLALIPLGELPVGEYQAEMIRLTEKEKQLDRRRYVPVGAEVEERIVCKSFNFSVTEQP